MSRTSTEDRYRRLLRLLPAWYRERYGDEMVDVYLAGHPEPDARLGAGEVAATAQLAVTTRLQAAGAPSRATLWLVALVSATLLAARAMSGLWRVVYSSLYTPTSWEIGAGGRLVEQTTTLRAGQAFEYGLYDLLWIAVVVLLVVGVRRVALAVALPVAVLDVSAGLGPLVARDARDLPMDATLTDARAALLPVVVIAAVALARGAAGTIPRLSARLVASGLVLATLYAIPLVLGTVAGDAATRPWSTWAVLAVTLAVAGLVVLAASRWLDPAWAAAVLTLAVVALVAGPLPAGATFSPRTEAESLAIGLAGAAVAAVLAAVAWFVTAGRHVPEHVSWSARREVVA